MYRNLVWALALFGVSLWAATIRVPDDQPAIQAAIDASSNGDDILVSPGTYNENIRFKGKAVRLHSAQGPSSTTIHGTGLDAVVTFADNETSASAIVGFTIENGGNSTSGIGEGGGVSVESSNPVIQGNIIQDNHASYAGAGIGVGFGSPTIANNTIRRNTGPSALGGGGISLRGSAAAIITGNTITDNQAGSFGGGIALWAAGSPVIRGNIITNNRGSDAGGISIVNGGAPLIDQNLIAGNTGTVGGISGPIGTVTANTIVNNNGSSASALGGFAGGDTLIANNILVALSGQTLNSCQGNPTNFVNNLVFAPAGKINSDTCSAGAPANHNIKADPLFVCPESGNYRLQPSSPAIDAGNMNPAPDTQVDLDGSARVVDGNGDGKAVVDIGAYEFAGASDIGVSAASLSFADQLVNSTSSPQTVTVSNSGSRRGTFCAVLSGDDFTLANPCTGSLDGGQSCDVQVSFRPAREGNRIGQLTVRSDAVNSPATVALAGTGLNPSPGLSSLAPTSAVVNGPDFTLQVSGSGFVASSVVTWNGQPRPTTFVSASVITAAISHADLAAGGSNQVAVVNASPGGGTSKTAAFAVTTPALRSDGLLNAANYKSQVAAGSLVALFGSSLSSGTGVATQLPLPTTLAGVSILMNGYAAPLFYVSPGQINLQVPWELDGATSVSIVVTTNGFSAPPFAAQLQPAAPGLLSTNQQGSGQGAILIAGTAQVASRARPVNRTEVIEIFCLGLGTVSPKPSSGWPPTGLSRTAASPVVEIGGIPGTVLFSGLAPGFAGLYQVNVRLPLNAPAGDAVSVVLKIGDVVSNTVTIAVQ